MRISAVNNNNNNPNFGIWKRNVYRDNKWDLERVIKHRNDTWFCREGFNDGTIYRYVTEKFKDVDKVNTYFWGCSDGCEVYTFLNEIFAKDGAKMVQKIAPITAIDYDPEAVVNAIYGVYTVEDSEIIDLEKSSGKKITENFELRYDKRNPEITTIRPRQELRDCVNFYIGDITKDYRGMKPENNLVFARNMWPYLEPYKLISIAKNLYNSMGENSLLVIGEYDPVGLRWNGIEADFLFKQAGFKSTDSPIIFEK